MVLTLEWGPRWGLWVTGWPPVEVPHRSLQRVLSRQDAGKVVAVLVVLVQPSHPLLFPEQSNIM